MSTINKGKPREIPFILLLPDPENLRLHPQANSDAIRACLKKSGQVQSLVVAHEKLFLGSDWQERYIVLSGNETMAQMKALGYKEAVCQEVEGSPD
jgi:predicted ATP-dependent endonuclease of OLD family